MQIKEFKKYVLEEPVVMNKYSIVSSTSFIVNCLVFPAMFFQMYKTYQRKESADFHPGFVTLQFFGGAPEGMIGAILGYLSGDFQTLLIGIYAMFYNAFMLFFRLFGRNAYITQLIAKNNKVNKVNNI
jgi:hypothetical protein